MNDVHAPIPAEKVRQVLHRSPSGYLSNEETLAAYKDLRKSLSFLLEDSKPAVEEPLGFGSIVRVANGMMVVRIGAAMRTPWRSGYDAWNWEDLDNPQLYRVGLTPADDPLSDDGAAAPPADYQGAPTPSAAERATTTAAPSSVSDLEYATRLDGTTMPAPMVVPNEHCWCGGEVGARIPGDHFGSGCLADVTHNWTAASQESQDLIGSETDCTLEGCPDSTPHYHRGDDEKIRTAAPSAADHVSLAVVLRVLDEVRTASITATEQEAVRRCHTAVMKLPTYVGCWP